MIRIGERPIDLNNIRAALAGPITVELSSKARGLISRKADCDDARRSHVALTRKGTLLFEEVFPAHLQHLQRAFGRLDDSELKRLRESLSQLQDAFEKEHAR